MTGDNDIDIEALLDAPLKQKQQVQRQSALDVIEAARHRHPEEENRRRRDVDERRNDDRRYDDRRRDDERRRDDRRHEDDRRYDDRRSRDDRGRTESRKRSRSPDFRAPLTEAQRDRRTVFCRQLAQRVRSADLQAFCEAAGPVRDVRIVYDRISNRSRGVAYVEFVEEATVPKAIAMTGQRLCGIPVIIELTETEKNRLAEEAAQAARSNKPASVATGSGGVSGGHASAPVGSVSFSRMTRVHVSHLHSSIDEKALRRAFEPFGDIDRVELLPDAPGTAHVYFRNTSDAGMAVDQMNGFELAGKPIRVGIMRDRPDGTNTIQYRVGDVFTASLDDAETQGLSLNSKARAELMMKLARDPVQMAAAGGPSPCLHLTGMYDPEEETELGWEYAIADEVREECSRFGVIQHINVPKTKDGEVWLRFAATPSAQDAQAKLNGRWFGGRQIKATFVNPAEYQRRFP